MKRLINIMERLFPQCKIMDYTKSFKVKKIDKLRDFLLSNENIIYVILYKTNTKDFFTNESNSVVHPVYNKSIAIFKNGKYWITNINIDEYQIKSIFDGNKEIIDCIMCNKHINEAFKKCIYCDVYICQTCHNKYLNFEKCPSCTLYLV